MKKSCKKTTKIIVKSINMTQYIDEIKVKNYNNKYKTN